MVKYNAYFIAIVASSIFIACGNRSKTERPTRYDYSEPEIYVPTYEATQPVTVDTVDRTMQMQQIIEEIATPAQSKYYQLGYEKGYDDGEDDAVNGNGYEASFDDGNSYSGQNKNDFEMGYCEGYEAGYDDNLEYADD